MGMPPEQGRRSKVRLMAILRRFPDLPAALNFAYAFQALASVLSVGSNNISRPRTTVNSVKSIDLTQVNRVKKGC